MSRIDPFSCEACTLPECDWHDSRCRIRKGANHHRALQRRGDETTEASLRAHRELYRMWEIEDDARRAEARQVA